MGKLISVQEAAKRLGVSNQTLKNWAKDGTIQLKGMSKGSRKFWVDEDVIAAISDKAADVERAKNIISKLHEELHTEERALRHAIREAKHSIRLVGMGHAGLRTTEFFKSFTWAMFIIDVINEREYKVIDLILEGMSLEEISDQFGLSNSRVLQIFLRACRKLGPHGNFKRYVVEAEHTKNELGKLRLDYEGLKTVIKKNEMQNETQDSLNMLREKYGSDFMDEYRKLDYLCGLFSLVLVEQDLSVRAMNLTKSADIETVGDLVRFQKSDVLKIRNMGRKTLTELDDFLESIGLQFGMDVDGIMSDRVLLREMASSEDVEVLAECQKESTTNL